MPKYLITASYSAEGLQGLQKDKASGRIRAATAAIEGLGAGNPAEALAAIKTTPDCSECRTIASA